MNTGSRLERDEVPDRDRAAPPKTTQSNPYVTYPTLRALDDILDTEDPDNDGWINEGDVEDEKLRIRDLDASNKAVPDVMAEILRYAGFVMTFFTDTDSNGFPRTSLKIMRRDGLSTLTPKLLYLAASGADSLDLSANNTSAFHLPRLQ